MPFAIRPVHDFDDVAMLHAPKNPSSSVCWCLSHRLDSRTNRELVGAERGDFVRGLCDRDVAPGVLAYDEDGTVVGGPRSPSLRAALRAVAEDPARRRPRGVVAVVCQGSPGSPGPGHRTSAGLRCRQLLLRPGAPAVEGYPTDNQGAKVDLTMAYVGTRAPFEGAGFTKVSDTDAVSGGFPRVVMRRHAEERERRTV